MTEHQKRLRIANWLGLGTGYLVIIAMIFFWPDTREPIHQIAGLAIVGCVLTLLWFKWRKS